MYLTLQKRVIWQESDFHTQFLFLKANKSTFQWILFHSWLPKGRAHWEFSVLLGGQSSRYAVCQIFKDQCLGAHMELVQFQIYRAMTLPSCAVYPSTSTCCGLNLISLNRKTACQAISVRNFFTCPSAKHLSAVHWLQRQQTHDLIWSIFVCMFVKSYVVAKNITLSQESIAWCCLM